MMVGAWIKPPASGVPVFQTPPEAIAGHVAGAKLLGRITLGVERSKQFGYANEESGMRTYAFLPVSQQLTRIPRGPIRAVPSESASLFLEAVRPSGLFLHLAKRRQANVRHG